MEDTGSNGRSSSLKITSVAGRKGRADACSSEPRKVEMWIGRYGGNEEKAQNSALSSN